jgi:hypothetical protein
MKFIIATLSLLVLGSISGVILGGSIAVVGAYPEILMARK